MSFVWFGALLGFVLLLVLIVWNLVAVCLFCCFNYLDCLLFSVLGMFDCCWFLCGSFGLICLFVVCFSCLFLFLLVGSGISCLWCFVLGGLRFICGFVLLCVFVVNWCLFGFSVVGMGWGVVWWLGLLYVC